MNNTRFYLNLARRRQGSYTGMQNAGWCYDNYPELLPLDAGTTIELANFEGPGVINCFHITQHLMRYSDHKYFMRTAKAPRVDEQGSNELQKLTSRGLILEIYYNNQKNPAVRCPLADFFADGCGGSAKYFSTPFVEKLPKSYNCYIPMPFKENIRIILRNETSYNCLSYSFVEYEKLPSWDEELMYFHCTWKQEKFQLNPETVKPIISIDGQGHYIGSHYSIVTNEPIFKDFFFVVEGNCEYRIDDETQPSIDYLGTEDSFGFSWGFQDTFCGLRSGINYLQTKKLPFQLSIYRFRDQNPIIFHRSLNLQINWKHEFTDGKRNYQTAPRKKIWQAINNGGGWVEYSTTHYWYQSSVGFDHEDLPSWKERLSSIYCKNFF